jgi:hypothetical protein
VKLTAIAVFGAGYVLGTRAGRERYDQLIALGTRLADRLEERADQAPATRLTGRVGAEWANGLGDERSRAGTGIG